MNENDEFYDHSKTFGAMKKKERERVSEKDKRERKKRKGNSTDEIVRCRSHERVNHLHKARFIAICTMYGQSVNLLMPIISLIVVIYGS